MKLLEIKNNLVKLSYDTNEDIRLATFVALVEEESKSYVAQIVNLKADATANYAIGKLIFIFSKDGMVDNYDGSIPSINAKLSLLDALDILKLIPLERPVIIGKLAQQNRILKLDETIFENHLTICAEKFEHISTVIKNSVSQIKPKDEKVIVIDMDHNFTEYEPIKFRRDFKLPLNYDFINFIYDNDLTEVDATSKAIIQDIFLTVQDYAKTTENGFIPFKTFIDVVNRQYKETDMPELALLKNKLLKYEEENIFAQTQEEIDALKNALDSHSVAYIDISETEAELQREVISYIHGIVDEIESYIYCFVKLTNNNSDKKLVKKLLDNEHIFTSIICSHNYKYISELKQRSDNIILFAPQTVQHDFASYNTLLNKLNANEFIVYGELTQNVPFIVELKDIENMDLEEEIVENVDVLEESSTFDLTQQADDFIQNSDSENVNVQNPFAEEISQENFDYDLDEQISDDQIVFEIENQTNTSEISAEDFQQNEITAEDLMDDNKVISDEIIENSTNNPVVMDNVPADVTNKVTSVEDIELTEDTVSLDDIAQTEDPVFADDSEDISDDETYETSIEDFMSEEDSSEEDLDFLDKLSEQQVYDAQKSDYSEQESEILFGENSEVIPDNDIPISIDDELNTITDDTNSDFEDEENLPVYPSEDISLDNNAIQFVQGDTVIHAKYGKGVIEKIIKYGNKTLCSVSFENVGRRLLDPAISELQKG